MSHFSVLVLVPEKPKSVEDAEGQVSELLAPYDENTQVETYKAKCHCVGWQASVESRNRAEEAVGSIALLKETYDDELQALIKTKLNGADFCHANKDEWWAARETAETEIKPTWQERIEPYIQRQKEILENHPLKDSPDPECETCNNTGQVDSTYNPKSKWDWWQIGGRWNGMLNPGYDPKDDPRNYETCYLCNGTGKRNDALGQEARAQDPTYGCNGCKDGRAFKWPTQWAEAPEGGNIRQVSEVLKLHDADHDVLPFALVRPTGEWLEKGEMGWWAVVSNEKANWKQAARAVLEEYPEHWAIVVDCHI